MAQNIYIILLTLCASKIISTAAGTGELPNGRTSHGVNSHIGFMGSRGKRDTNHFDNEKLDESTLGDSTVQSVFFKDTGNLIENETNDHNIDKDMYLRNIPELLIFKRTPPGFMGMRGKKDFEYSDYSRSDEYDFDPENPRIKKVFLQGINRGLLFNSVIPKRAPSGFVGMRGKKAFEDYKSVLPTSGFYGVRGKKPYLGSTLLNDELENLLQSDSMFDDNFEQTKRDNKQGFFGMRGKRFPNDYSDFHDNDLFDKRAPTGFMGMRGKRFFNDYDGGASLVYDTVKRQPSGFFGVRGKKDLINQQSTEERQLEKRAALAQFFGTRGKKQPFNSGFFGMRGKKQPFEFRGKFVGVRGKKDDSLQRLETELNEFPENIKRTPSGFIGMRGKKEGNIDTKE